MQIIDTTTLWKRFELLEQSWCLQVNRGCRYPALHRCFCAISRLGDGVFWYLLMAALALGSADGAAVAAQMAVTGLVGLAIYRQVKHRLVRERPYIVHAGIRLGTAPLDRYSFPSGHTLHAVTFTSIATAHIPELGLVLVPFALLVAASRVALGLHYPTDVAAGALLGLALAAASLSLAPV